MRRPTAGGAITAYFRPNSKNFRRSICLAIGVTGSCLTGPCFRFFVIFRSILSPCSPLNESILYQSLTNGPNIRNGSNSEVLLSRQFARSWHGFSHCNARFLRLSRIKNDLVTTRHIAQAH